jgi:hypothetical protein
VSEEVYQVDGGVLGRFPALPIEDKKQNFTLPEVFGTFGRVFIIR